MKSSKQSNYSATGAMKRVRLTVMGLSGLVFMLVAGGDASAQQRIESDFDLKVACETNPGNVVTLDQSTKIFDDGTGTKHVDSGCTLILGPGVSLETDQIRLIFAAPLVVQSADKAEVKLNKSSFSAPWITISLTGTGSALALSDSGLDAYSGNLRVALGDEGRMEVKGNRSSCCGAGLEYGQLNAFGAVQISGGRKLLLSLAEISVNGRQGVDVAMDGADGSFKVDEVRFQTTGGSVAITASGMKALVELHNVDFGFRDSFAARLAGGESSIVLKRVSLSHPVPRSIAGDVTFEAGSGSATYGKIEASELGIFEVGSVAILASLTGEGGVVKLDKSSVDAVGDVVIETGPKGTTDVRWSFEGASVRIASGPGGSCVRHDFLGRELAC